MPELTRCHITDGVAILTLNRPAARNALCAQLIAELDACLDACSTDDGVRVLLLTGSGDHFAAGADLKEMQDMGAAQVAMEDFAGCSKRLGAFPKPTIAAVDGFALGGGCELVEMCDIVVASERARFAHPEYLAGTMPGAGGTQRLPRVLGKHLAMDLLLSGRQLTAREAEQHGLVSRVVEPGALMETALTLARQIAGRSAPVAQLLKAAVQAGLEDAQGTGLVLERRLFQMTFALEDRQEGMRAFVEKRPAQFRHR